MRQSCLTLAYPCECECGANAAIGTNTTEKKWRCPHRATCCTIACLGAHIQRHPTTTTNGRNTHTHTETSDIAITSAHSSQRAHVICVCVCLMMLHATVSREHSASVHVCSCKSCPQTCAFVLWPQQRRVASRRRDRLCTPHDGAESHSLRATTRNINQYCRTAARRCRSDVTLGDFTMHHTHTHETYGFREYHTRFQCAFEMRQQEAQQTAL